MSDAEDILYSRIGSFDTVRDSVRAWPDFGSVTDRLVFIPVRKPARPPVLPERPRYEVTAQVFLPLDASGHSRLVEPGEVIEFDGVPNQAMKPLNKPAMEAFYRFARTLR